MSVTFIGDNYIFIIKFATALVVFELATDEHFCFVINFSAGASWTSAVL